MARPRRRPAPPAPDRYRLDPASDEPLTWDQYLGPPDSIARYGAPMRPLPWALDWQRNPAAPPPPGWHWARCLCFATLVRPPDWHGQVRSRELRLLYSVKPATTYRHWNVRRSTWEGSTCDGCGAPLQRIDHPHDPYPWPFDLAEGLARAATRPPLYAVTTAPLPAPAPAGLVVQAPGVAYRRPAPLDRWSRFPSMAAERAWVAAQRRQTRRVS